MPPIEGYDTAFRARIRIVRAGVTLADRALPHTRDAMLWIEGPFIELGDSGAATVRLYIHNHGNDELSVAYGLDRTNRVTASAVRTKSTEHSSDRVYDVVTTASSGNVSARSTYRQGIFNTNAPTLTITRAGRAYVMPRIDSVESRPVPYGSVSGPLFVDLRGSGESDLVYTATVRGASCCVQTLVYEFDFSSGTYHRYVHDWSYYKNAPHLVRLHGAREVTFVARNIDYSSAAGADTAMNGIAPLQLWAFRSHRFVDVTREHPNLVRRDAAGLLAFIRTSNDRSYAKRAYCAAYAADRFTLGERAGGKAVLHRYCSESDPHAFAQIHAALKNNGYE